jgi:hypothetical protein
MTDKLLKLGKVNYYRADVRERGVVHLLHRLTVPRIQSQRPNMAQRCEGGSARASRMAQ